ncbi:hypothetical protein MHUMG1_03459 [Metarhizium humberi]|uniref:Uncharacterized protein n=1 Tax=Metarhizium humberi TaxID=2596975 RepID=A0A9P8S9T0_9HYPO|nr:hypothetical protein MHUMG1_03459 [Metarhizium humberi]
MVSVAEKDGPALQDNKPPTKLPMDFPIWTRAEDDQKDRNAGLSILQRRSRKWNRDHGVADAADPAQRPSRLDSRGLFKDIAQPVVSGIFDALSPQNGPESSDDEKSPKSEGLKQPAAIQTQPLPRLPALKSPESPKSPKSPKSPTSPANPTPPPPPAYPAPSPLPPPPPPVSNPGNTDNYDQCASAFTCADCYHSRAIVYWPQKRCQSSANVRCGLDIFDVNVSDEPRKPGEPGEPDEFVFRVPHANL